MLFLALVFAYLVIERETTQPPVLKARLANAAAQAASPEYSARIKAAEQLLEAGNMGKLKPLLDELIGGHPYQAEPLMVLADYYIRRQEPMAAMHAFRQALDLNLDYLEKQSPLYQGKKIRNTVREAEEQLNLARVKSPADPTIRESRQEVYYMLRKLAGGCSD